MKFEEKEILIDINSTFKLLHLYKRGPPHKLTLKKLTGVFMLSTTDIVYKEPEYIIESNFCNVD